MLPSMLAYRMSTVTNVLVWLLWLSIVKGCRQSMHIIASAPVAYAVSSVCSKCWHNTADTQQWSWHLPQPTAIDIHMATTT